MKRKFQTGYFILVLLLIIGIVTIAYFAYWIYQLENQKTSLASELETTKKNLQENIDSLSGQLSQMQAERDDFERKYYNEKTRMDFLSSQISGIAGTVGLLEKLQQTDPELLQKYSKIYFLNENYVPKELVEIDEDYVFNPDKEYLFYAKTYSFLQDLMADARTNDIDIEIISAYRSFGAQSELKYNYKLIYGSGANQFSADQGYSEHQLGTTVDFTTSKVGDTFIGFEKTEAYQWLQDNAYKYGFVISYPEDNAYYEFEPWHWRFIGRILADKLHQEGKSFYDLDQRQINEHLLFFFD